MTEISIAVDMDDRISVRGNLFGGRIKPSSGLETSTMTGMNRNYDMGGIF